MLRIQHCHCHSPLRALGWITPLTRLPARSLCLLLLTAGVVAAGLTVAVGEVVHLAGNAGVAALFALPTGLRLGRKRT